MFANLAGLSRISMARLLDYARERRPAGPGHVKHIKAEFLKKSALMGSRVAHFPQRIDAGEKQISVGGRADSRSRYIVASLYPDIWIQDRHTPKNKS